MKMLKKLALVSAVSMISAGAFAMEAMDEETMSATTGQDGITILVSPATKTAAELTALGVTAGTQTAIDVGGVAGEFKGLSISQIVVHDNDGIAANTTSGALVIGSGGADSTVVFADDTSPISVVIDMVGDNNGATAGGEAMLNVAITTPTLAIKLGDIYVADSYNKGVDNTDNSSATQIGTALSGDDADNAGVTDGNAHRDRTKILEGFEIVMGSSTTTIQLGSETQGGMISLGGTLTNGLTINGFELFDANSGGSIQASSLKLTDAGGSNLQQSMLINAVGNAGPLGEGLYITITQFGTLAGGADLSLNNLAIGQAGGAAADLGDVQILGLNVTGTTMVIKGH